MRRNVILAAGDFPRKGTAPRELLDNAARVICCDGAADILRRRARREPDAVVGDLDSLKGRFANTVRIGDQETNDLEKAAAYCKAKGLRNPIVVGATGGRDDHSIGNIFRAIDLGLETVTENGRFIPFDARIALTLQPGTPVSVFAARPGTKMSSQGLAWPLDGVAFDAVYRATLNKTSARRAVIRTNKRACVYIPFK